MLTWLRLPRGAVRVSRAPVGAGGTLSGPAVAIGAYDLVCLHRWWVLRGHASSLLARLQSHPPAGARWSGSGPVYTASSVKRGAFVSFDWEPITSAFDMRELIVEATDLGHGRVGVRADAQTQWVIPRPAREMVPAGVTQIEIMRGQPGQAPQLAVTVSDPSTIEQIVGLINGLDTVQPAVWHCPPPIPGYPPPPEVQFTFSGAPGAPPLATASVQSDPIPSTSPCDALELSLPGAPEIGLIEAAMFLKSIDRLTNTTLSPET